MKNEVIHPKKKGDDRDILPKKPVPQPTTKPGQLND